MPVYTPIRPLLTTLQEYGSGSGSSSSSSSSKGEEDIDVLFYGGRSERRERMKGEMEVWARSRGYRLVFDLSYDVMGEVREDLLRRARVVLNLHSVPSRVLEVRRREEW